MNASVDRLLNVGLRGATLAARFLFIFFLAKYLEPASVGLYGLFTAAIGLSLYFVGLDFYTYTTREIIKTPNEERGRLLKGHVALSVIMYMVSLPFILVFIANSDWPLAIVIWFIPILILEHINQELSRLLIAMSSQHMASILLFIRQGSWALVIVALMAWSEQARQLELVMAVWAVAGVLAACLGMWKIYRLQMGGWSLAIDWRWIKNGVVVSAAFLVATIALRSVQTVDRFWYESLASIDLVGAYVLFIGVAGTLLVFLDAAVFSYAYPELIRLYNDKKLQLLKKKVREMLLYTILFSGAFGFVSWLLLPYLLDWIDNPIYIESIALYPWLLFGMVVYAISLVPHFGLYAQGCDKPIIYSHLATLLGFIVSVWLLIPDIGSIAVPAGLIIAFFIMLIWKSISYIHKTSQFEMR